MTTPITPSLSHLLNPQAAPPRPAAQGGGFASALAAQKAFFQQVTAPKMTPATYTAADIQKAAPQPSAPLPATGSDQPVRRPGSFLNIVV
ncbi:MAG TPA: hypothetical protein VF402_07335 [Asticcacaulis sp.]|mgnify:FL=1|jgi:hypothetical protein